MNRKVLLHLKQRLARQSTWTAIATTAASAALLIPAYAVPLGAVALLAGPVKPFLVEDSTYTPETERANGASPAPKEEGQ